MIELGIYLAGVGKSKSMRCFPLSTAAASASSRVANKPSGYDDM